MSGFETEIAIRAYTERPNKEPLGSKRHSTDLPPSELALVFDCETTIDAAQQLQVGFFQVREFDALIKTGAFIDPNQITSSQEQLIKNYTSSEGIELIHVRAFRELLLEYGFRLGATIVGFNLPFDLSRIALGHGAARYDKRGGYCLFLTKDRNEPRIRIKHLSPRAAMINFSQPRRQDVPRGMRNRGIEVQPYRGHFVDIKTLAAALMSRSFSLGSLAKALNTEAQKHETDEHGEITDSYLDYARADVQVTWECYQALKSRYEEHGLSQAESKILSEATIGKAYLQDMGITPFLGCDPGFDRGHLGQILCAYYGGRAEVRIRREICEVLYCDFKSMYPTVNGLMGLWYFVIADGIQSKETTQSTQEWLESVTLSDLQNPDTWKQLTTLVQIKPDKDLFPVRTKYSKKKKDAYTIGLNYLSAKTPLWFTLADCVVSKLLTGKTPRIEKAISYLPGNRQENLKPIKILGLDDYSINPNTDDPFIRLIDLRDEAKQKGDSIEKTLKIIANSTSYGIFIEINRDDAPKSEKLNVFGPNGDCNEINSKAIEEPGRFFHPLLGVLITGAARLMLGIAEKLTIDNGLDWAFCDTDSLAITRTKGISREEFHDKAQNVVNWFKALNPYKKSGSVLQQEDINFAINSDQLKPLYCFAISAKRYALFNLDSNKNPILRKASAHGLGHLIEPYSEKNAPIDCPKPQAPLPQIGVKRWQHDFWIKILESALAGNPNQVAIDWHPSLIQPAAQRYSASSAQLLTWLDEWNREKPYEEQIRPFGFLLAFMPRSGLFAPAPDPEECVVAGPKRGRPPKSDEIKPIAPFNSDPAKALPDVFDRVSGDFIPSERLKTYAEALCQYHLSPETKFANADYFDQGQTERRHVTSTDLVFIGKEANRIGDSGERDAICLPCQEFGA